MGYSTDLYGKFNLNKPLAPEHSAYLKAFSETRRMKRNASETRKRPDPIRKAAGLEIGPEGAYFVGAEGFFGQETTPDIVDYNRPPEGQPGLWCHWVPTEDGSGIEWDGAEKFYDYDVWIKYLIHHFLAPAGYVLNGEVEWQGEDSSDIGKIIVKDNEVSLKPGRVVYD